ncbi:MMPL family transporter [Paenibacillus lemnae]|uniref:MMPL family transporter n=1 Tax=Paenibacillus lemnae TaxID=1330551 RepID=A0A848M4F7_PAELE|nr:MMPL family transporter [Paenibacillus lemnae]NMO95139.1 MMPL family transporter [Paenibacillus lemnae]
MSTFLYKVAKSAFNKPWHYIVSWVAVLAIVIAMIGINGMHSSSDMKIEGTEAQKVLDQLAEELPAASGGQGSVVFTASEGERLDTPERLALISKAVNDVYNEEYVINPAELAAQAAAAGMTADGGADPSAAPSASGETGQTDPAAAGQADPSAAGQADPSAAGQADPSAAGQAAAPPYGPLIVDGVSVPGVLVASDGSVALFQFQFTVAQTSVPKSVLDSIVNSVEAVEEGSSGITALPGDTLEALSLTSPTEAIGIVIAAVVLFMTLGSLIAAGLPLLTAILGVAISVGGAFGISKFIVMTDITPALALMVGLAVGIDYSLFIVNRQRRMILDGKLNAEEAASRAVGTAGSAVFFAGMTVIVALCGMLVIGIEFLSTMALVAAASVFVNVLIALTLLPALLGLVGERIVSAKARAKYNEHAATSTREGFAYRWVKGVVKHRILVIIGSVVLLGAAAIPVAEMKMGIPSSDTANLDTTARQSYDAVAGAFGEGFNNPLIIVAESRDDGKPVAPEMLGGALMELQNYEDVALVSPMGMNADGSMAIISLIPKSGPNDEATKDLVKALRNPDADLAKNFNLSLGVTGITAINIDMSEKLAEVFPLYIGIIVILSIIILLLVFRSIIVPIKATIGFVLSVLATFGITTAVFQWGWLHSLFAFDTGGPLLSFMPIMVTGILYGLAMDYQVFLVSSMREAYVHGHRGSDSVVLGYQQASRVVLAAAVIMVSVFAGFIFSHDVMIKQIGFALAIGILVDAFIVRMMLVPALMSVFGNKAWWLPKWMDRLLPNLDVEGDKLIAQLKSSEGQVRKANK